MRNALVTGGCGFLGSFIARQLVDRGAKVRVLAAPGERRDNLDGVKVEIVEGDVCDPRAMEKVVAGCDVVFHAAAIYSDWMPDPTRMYDVNLRGTFHVLQAAQRAGVGKVIYTASMVAVGRPPEGALGDEATPYEAWALDFPYSRSKYHSRELAEYFVPWGLDVRVVCPGVIFGPNDIRPTPSGKIILNSLAGGPGVYTEGGASYVDVRDAAAVHLLAAETGRAGERYLAVAHNLSTRELIAAIDSVIGRKRRLVKIPVSVARALAKQMEARAERTGKPPMLARAMFEYSLRPNFYSNRKAVEELGATFRPLDETIRDAVDWFKAKGMARSRKRA